MYAAYDYETQRWIEGEPARLLLIKQLSSDLEFYRGHKGIELARMQGYPSVTAAIRFTEVELAKVQR